MVLRSDRGNERVRATIGAVSRGPEKKKLGYPPASSRNMTTVTTDLHTVYSVVVTGWAAHQKMQHPEVRK